MKTIILCLFAINCQAQKPKIKDFLIPALLKIPQGFFRGAAEAKWFYGDLNSFKNKYRDFDNGDFSPAFFGSKTIFVMFTDDAHRYNAISNFSGELSQVIMPDMKGLKFWEKVTVVAVMTIIKGSFRNLAHNYIFKPRI
jgi:hypothetical protein